MPKTCKKRQAPSLFSLCVDYVGNNLQFYLEFLNYLPIIAKERILNKFQTGRTSLAQFFSSKTLSDLIYPRLKCIDFSSMSIDDDTLCILERCKQLVSLNLRSSEKHNISSAGLENLFKNTINLLDLDISHCSEFNDDALISLAINCPKLCKLLAKNCNISDLGFFHLTENNKKLKFLNIAETKITGKSIRYAVKNRNLLHLEVIVLDGCSDVDSDVLKAIMKDCPEIGNTTFDCLNTDSYDYGVSRDPATKNVTMVKWSIKWN